jgi:type IV secretion system protein TrbG
MKTIIRKRSIYTTYILLAAAAVPLAGCDSTPPPETVYLQAARLTDPPPPVVKEIPVPVAVPQWRLLPETRPSIAHLVNQRQVIEAALQSATQAPSEGVFIQAVQTYDYVPGMVYQVIASPGHVTTILLEPGEQLLAKVCGDTAQWLIGDTPSGSGDDARTLVLIKPLKPDLQTNLVLSTSQRVYQIDLQSLGGVYHSAVQWTYPADFARQLAEDQKQQGRIEEATIEPAVKLSQLDFGYSIRAQGNPPDWMPLRVFTDGHKTFIAFPQDLDAKEAPPLFVLSRKDEAQLVNYRQRGNYYIVDQVIATAELRLGESPQQVVHIERDGM